MGVWLAEAAALELCAEAREAAVANTVKTVYSILILIGNVCGGWSTEGEMVVEVMCL